MSLFQEFSSLLPYLQSIRKLETYLSFDVSIPKNWRLLKRFIDEEKVLEQPSKVNNERMFSFISEIDETSMNNIIKNISGIIDYNLELEEKEKLFQNKVDELKTIFEKSNLNNLKGLSFEIKSEVKKIKLENG